MDGCEKKYNPRNNQMFHEETLFHPDLPGIGQITGPADYLIGPSAVQLAPDTREGDSANLLTPGHQIFLVVEAKRSTTVAEQKFIAQLLAQLLALELGDEK
jgi:hypothetical protein